MTQLEKQFEELNTAFWELVNYTGVRVDETNWITCDHPGDCEARDYPVLAKILRLKRAISSGMAE